MAALLLQAWSSPEQQAARQLELAQAAATRSCAYLRCANVGCEGGPFAGQGADSKRCRCAAAMVFLAVAWRLQCTAMHWDLQTARPSMLKVTAGKYLPCLLPHTPAEVLAARCGTAAPPARTPTGGRGTSACARRWRRRGRRRKRRRGRRRRQRRSIKPLNDWSCQMCSLLYHNCINCKTMYARQQAYL